MKKRNFLCFALLFSLLLTLLSGCRAALDQGGSATADATTDPIDSNALTYQVQTPYFTVDLPAYWQESALVVQDGGPQSSTMRPFALRFYEKQSREAQFGGHLFSIELWREEGDYTYLPQYRLLGYLTDNNGGKYHLLVVYPSDVQFDVPYQQLYSKMSAEDSQVTSSLLPLQGYTYSPADSCNLFFP